MSSHLKSKMETCVDDIDEVSVDSLCESQDELLEVISLTSTLQDGAESASEQKSSTWNTKEDVQVGESWSLQDCVCLEGSSVTSTFTLLDAASHSEQDGMSGAFSRIDQTDDDWTDAFSLATTFTLLEDHLETGSSVSDWEVLSEASSKAPVRKSYCHALKFGRAAPASSTHRTQSSHRQRKPSGKQSYPKTIKEEPTPIDSDFIMEGIKGSRGGKASLHFKGNQKTEWRPGHGKPKFNSREDIRELYGRKNKAHSYKKQNRS